MLVLAKPMFVARLLASDFPSENRRTQTRNEPYTKPIAKPLKIFLSTYHNLNLPTNFQQDFVFFKKLNDLLQKID